MTALLTADEAARLVPGEQLVIVRPGDTVHYDSLENAWVNGERRVDLDHVGWEHDKRRFVAPQDWVALTGPCPEPDCRGGVIQLPEWEGHTEPCPQPHARDGRRIVPLYTKCPPSTDLELWEMYEEAEAQFGDDYFWTKHGHVDFMTKRRAPTLVGRAVVVSIEPEDDGRNFRITLDVVVHRKSWKHVP